MTHRGRRRPFPSLVLQRQDSGGARVCEESSSRSRWRRFLCERLAHSFRSCVACNHSHSSSFVNRFRGSNSPTTRATWGRVPPLAFPPPRLLQRQQKGTRHETERQVTVPARPTPHLILVEPDMALVRLDLRLDRPATRAHPREGLHG